MGYDVIGDIHGQAGKLEAMLRKLGYEERATSWVSPQGRQAVFLGDLIDRGPEQIKVVDTVRRMVGAGHARCVMGNHEFNAIGFLSEDPNFPGQYLRPHTKMNLEQHIDFLRQVGQGSTLHGELVDWFRTLPPMLDLGEIRVVHAWWHQSYADLVAARLPAGKAMCDDFLVAAYQRDSDEYRAMEGLTKGLEVTLPQGGSFTDHSRVERHEVRTKWWLDGRRTYREVAILGEAQRHRVADELLPTDYAGQPVDGTPVFIGHYWMEGTPQLQSPKVACVDYSAAKDGPLVCYRWNGEQILDAGNFVQAG
jgi:hypothetical protein